MNPERTVVGRRRPRDRKDQIARVAAESFSELGYHGVSMQDLAGRVGVTAASLYRHYDSKYELFRASVLGLSEKLLACTAFVDQHGADGVAAEEAWDRAVSALVETTVTNRSSGGLYRWERRYLHADDQAVLDAQIKCVNARLQRVLARLRPALSTRERLMLSSAVLSVIGSITDHRARLPTARIHTTLSRIADDIRDTDVPCVAAPSGAPHSPAVTSGGVGEYERILGAAMRLFAERGYRDTGMDDVAASVAMAASGLYRFFSGKGAILSAAFRRGADRVSGDLSQVLAAGESPAIALDRLVHAYVRRSCEDPELAYVYYAERTNLPADDRAALHNIQRATVEAWARLLGAARPELLPNEARFAVHAAFSMVVDLEPLVRHGYARAGQAPQPVLRRLMQATLVGHEPG
ncbi:TetR/AcrR family transcriptional regulator [Mycolicibacterium palauense]|uniref:TetR/AcrR family transcriptional regulator n=1 Tax=Mycolicibacterium palauense TaxID=2034511 RepID=UPI001FE2D1A9|nr:TetR/AcrR family transcriptional regulator [Mycolicibacterium palauense]